MRKQLDLAGQAAIVTGATSGMGRRFTMLLAARGVSVVALGRDQDRLANLATSAGSMDGSILPIEVDLGTTDDFRDIFDKAEAAAGTVSILVNAAGILNPGSATRMTAEVFDRTLAVNLRAPFLLSREMAARLIREELPGRIVNIASMAAFTLLAGGTAIYAASKAGLVRMTEALALEWAAHRINVNAIAPGTFDTDMTSGLVARIGTGFADRFPRRRIGDVAHLDSTLLYLVSPEASSSPERRSRSMTGSS